MATVMRDGVKLAFEDRGAGKPAFIFVHGVLEFDARAAAALCKVPALHLAASPLRMPPSSIREPLPNIVDGCTVGAGHFNQLEVPDQVNAMIESFLQHYL